MPSPATTKLAQLLGGGGLTPNGNFGWSTLPTPWTEVRIGVLMGLLLLMAADL